MERLLKKFETAQVAGAARRSSSRRARTAEPGVIYFGSTSPAMDEALDALEHAGLHLDALRVSGFPFPRRGVDFIVAHDQVFVVEQNRDAQLLKLIVNECGIDPARLIPSCITTARRSPRASSPGAIGRTHRRQRHAAAKEAAA